jgi:hypothetical protein
VVGVEPGREDDNVGLDLAAVVDDDTVVVQSLDAAVHSLAVGPVDGSEVAVLKHKALGHERKVGDNLVLEVFRGTLDHPVAEVLPCQVRCIDTYSFQLTFSICLRLRRPSFSYCQWKCVSKTPSMSVRSQRWRNGKRARSARVLSETGDELRSAANPPLTLGMSHCLDLARDTTLISGSRPKVPTIWILAW